MSLIELNARGSNLYRILKLSRVAMQCSKARIIMHVHNNVPYSLTFPRGKYFVASPNSVLKQNFMVHGQAFRHELQLL